MWSCRHDLSPNSIIYIKVGAYVKGIKSDLLVGSKTKESRDSECDESPKIM